MLFPPGGDVVGIRRRTYALDGNGKFILNADGAKQVVETDAAQANACFEVYNNTEGGSAVLTTGTQWATAYLPVNDTTRAVTARDAILFPIEVDVNGDVVTSADTNVFELQNNAVVMTDLYGAEDHVQCDLIRQLG